MPVEPIPKIVLELDEQRGPPRSVFSKQDHKWRLDVGPNSLVGNPTGARAAAVNVQFAAPLSLDSDGQIRYDSSAVLTLIASLRADLTAETNARIAADTAEASARTTAIAAETTARTAADAAEVTARGSAILTETNARIAADATLQPIPTSSTDYRVGSVLFCKTNIAINNDTAIAGSQLHPAVGIFQQWAYTDDNGTVAVPNIPIYLQGSGGGGTPHFQLVIASNALTGTWKNITGANLVAAGAGIFVRTA